jgi:hypothetical protein
MSDNEALIFIPDISGFTRFVNDTEIQHSQHIIEELIEIILQANSIKMEVSEIEGDAVLFYRQGEAPTPEEIGAQTKNMFLNFHQFLRHIEKDTICQCGACKTTSNLTLKFILHYGEIGLSRIREHTKLMGKEVILAHRLLKNNIHSSEYLLMTENYMHNYSNEIIEKGLDWSELEDGSISYEHIGGVNFKFLDLSSLHSQLKSVPSVRTVEKFPNPIEVSTVIEAPMSLIYTTIVDLSQRIKWTEGLKNITYDQEEVPRLGMKHICDLPSGMLELETIQNMLQDGKIEYAERATKILLFPGATSIYSMQDKGNNTILTVQFHYKQRFIIGWFIDLIFRKKLEGNLIKSSQNLKRYCEDLFKK